MDLSPCIFLLRVIDELVPIALERPITAGRVCIEPTARSDGEVRRLLHRLHREILGRLEDHRPLATDPGDDRGPIFLIMATAWLALLPAPACPAAQRLLPALLGLTFVARRVIEVIRFDRALQLAFHLIRQGGIAQPPAPAIARSDMDTHFSGNAPGRTGETQQEGSENPV